MNLPRFRKGDHVRIAPWTDAFMQGMTSGTISSIRGGVRDGDCVRGGVIFVRWTLNPKVTRRCSADALTLVSGVR